MILSETSQHLAGALDRRVRRVELLGTAQPWFAPTVRGLIADLAARADFDLDSIADVRMAVDQACGTLLEHGGPDARLRCVLRWDAQQQGNVFLTFAIPTIQGELRRYFRDRTWSIRVPRPAFRSYSGFLGHNQVDGAGQPVVPGATRPDRLVRELAC